MDEPGTLPPKGVRSQTQPPDETLGLLCPWDGHIRGIEWSGTIFSLWEL